MGCLRSFLQRGKQEEARSKEDTGTVRSVGSFRTVSLKNLNSKKILQGLKKVSVFLPFLDSSSTKTTMSDVGGDEMEEDVGTTPTDFFDHEPTKQEKIEVSAITTGDADGKKTFRHVASS